MKFGHLTIATFVAKFADRRLCGRAGNAPTACRFYAALRQYRSWPEPQIRITQLASEGSPPPGLRLRQAKLSRNSNQIARGRIRRFESDMPSQPVRLPRHFAALGTPPCLAMARASLGFAEPRDLRDLGPGEIRPRGEALGLVGQALDRQPRSVTPVPAKKSSRRSRGARRPLTLWPQPCFFKSFVAPVQQAQRLDLPWRHRLMRSRTVLWATLSTRAIARLLSPF